MYRGFQYEATRVDDDLIRLAKTSYEKHKRIVKESLSEYLQADKSLNGKKMSEDWFPQIECDVFISHSHADEDKALTLAGWLLKNFNISSFIDSCVWGNAYDLQVMVDKEYCYNEKNVTYDYNSVMFSSSHIHMMLASSLTMMIDKAECIFFLNTPNSLSVGDTISKTKSPWIYHELSTCNLIRKRLPEMHRPEIIEDEREVMKKAEELSVEYEIDLSILTMVTESDLSKWGKECNKRKYEALDVWYKMTYGAYRETEIYQILLKVPGLLAKVKKILL